MICYLRVVDVLCEGIHCAVSPRVQHGCIHAHYCRYLLQYLYLSRRIIVIADILFVFLRVDGDGVAYRIIILVFHFTGAMVSEESRWVINFNNLSSDLLAWEKWFTTLWGKAIILKTTGATNESSSFAQIIKLLRAKGGGDTRGHLRKVTVVKVYLAIFKLNCRRIPLGQEIVLENIGRWTGLPRHRTEIWFAVQGVAIELALIIQHRLESWCFTNLLGFGIDIGWIILC